MANNTEKVSEEVETAAWHMAQYCVKMAVKQPKRLMRQDEFMKLFYQELAFQRLEFDNWNYDDEDTLRWQ